MDVIKQNPSKSSSEMFLELTYDKFVGELKKYNIEKISGDSISYTIKDLSFDKNDKIENSINEIVNSINELNKKYTKDIDEVMSKF